MFYSNKPVRQSFPFSFRRFNVSHFGDRLRCWSSPVTQHTYILVLTTARSTSRPAASPFQRPQLKLVARYDDPFGAAIDFDTATETRILESLGKDPFTHSKDSIKSFLESYYFWRVKELFINILFWILVLKICKIFKKRFYWLTKFWHEFAVKNFVRHKRALSNVVSFIIIILKFAHFFVFLAENSKWHKK